MDEWVPDPRPVAPELTPAYRADPFMVPVLDRLDQATLDRLSALLARIDQDDV